ncbi:MAG: carboxypeptidase-like regulatory domain-containing protein [Bryobacteraceae bacterium]
MRSLVGIFVLGCSATALMAQGNFGSITGDVLDQSGAAVPNAAVRATNMATGLLLSTETTTAGNYLIPNVPNGEYSVTVAAASFKGYRQQPVIVSTATTTTVNVQLELGAVTESVTVQETSTRIESTTSGIGSLLSEKAYKQLPLDITGMDQGSSGLRQPQQFLFLTPGVTGTSFSHRMSGSQQNSESVQIDGHNWMLLNNPGRVVSNPPPFDAIEEFKVNTAQYSAENPTGTGGTQLTFKSGTDQFHGGVFHLSRNDFFNARGFFARQTSPLKLNESSLSLGGPVLIPKLYNGNHRTHFYFTTTRFSRRGQENAASQVTVPTAEFKRGDFSGYVDARGTRLPIFDPATTRQNGAGGFTRDAFPNNVIPASRIGTVGRNAAALMPDPTLPGVINNYIIIAATKEDWWMYSAKVDHAWNASQISRVTAWFFTRDRNVVSGYPGILAPDSTTYVVNRNVLLSHTSIVSPRIVNETRWSLAPWIPSQRNLGPYEESGSQVLGIPNHPSAPGVTPQLIITGLSPNLGNANLIPFFSTRRNFSYGDTVSWVRGRHQIKFGFTHIISFDDTQRFLNRMGQLTFSNLSTSQPDSASFGAWGNGFASFLIGDVSTGNRLINDAWDRERVRRFESFVQDDFKISRKLTLNIGLRYHIPFAFIDGENRISALDLTVPNAAAGGRLGAMVFAGEGAGRTGKRSLVDNYYKAFEPRFGFAYAISQKMVLRGGYGVYNAFAPANTTINGSPRDGFTFNQDLRTLNQGITPAFNINNGFPNPNVTLPLLNPALRNGTTAVHVSPDANRPPISLNWSLGIQRELPWNLFVDASYVANKGSRMPAQLENLNQLNPSLLRLGALLNQNITSAAAVAAGYSAPYPGFTGTVGQSLRPYPQFTAVDNLFQSTGYSSYNSLQVKIDKRFSNGLLLMNAYTLAKLIDTGGSARGTEDPLAMDTFNRNLEKSISADDQTHTFVTSLIYELPVGHGKRWLSSSRLLGNILGNWSIASSLRYFTGVPLGIGSATPLPLFGGGNRSNRVEGLAVRPDISGKFDPGRDRWINRAAFADPAPFTFGTSGRRLSELRAPGFANENLSLVKHIVIREGHTVDLKAIAHNLTNRTVFGAPNTSLASPAFGTINSQVSLPRQLELNLQYRF